MQWVGWVAVQKRLKTTAIDGIKIQWKYFYAFSFCFMPHTIHYNRLLFFITFCFALMLGYINIYIVILLRVNSIFCLIKRNSIRQLVMFAHCGFIFLTFFSASSSFNLEER